MIGAVLLATQGSYSDTTTWVVALFADVELAHAHKVEAETEVRRVTTALDLMVEAGDLEYTGGVQVTDAGGLTAGYGAHKLSLTTSLASLGLQPLSFRESLTLCVVEMELRGIGGAT